MGAYCANTVAVGGGSGFGYSLSSCRDAVLNSTANPKCSGSIFDFNRGYNGQCKCATDNCLRWHRHEGYNIYRVSPGVPASGVDITVNLTDVGLAPVPASEYVEVYDIWERRVVGSVHLSQARKLRAINPAHSQPPSHSLARSLTHSLTPASGNMDLEECFVAWNSISAFDDHTNLNLIESTLPDINT